MMRTLWIVAVALALTPLVSVAEPPTSTKERLDNLEEDLDKLAHEVEEIGGMACSATQQDNSVLITCGDGTSGVIAGAGTVVLYPEGQIGEVPPIDYNTGPIVAVDASGVVLGLTTGFDFDNDPPIWVYINLDVGGSARLFNLPDTQEVKFTVGPNTVFFLSEDCSGPAFLSNGMIEINSQFFMQEPSAPQADILVNSRLSTGWWDVVYDSSSSPQIQYFEGSGCETHSNILMGASPAVEYIPAPEITNAVYPVTIEQLAQ
jgi:hypothetical protein